MSMYNPLETVYFLKLPEDHKFSAAAFPLDLDIPLPVQKKEADAPGSFNQEEITEEQILAGILIVVAHDRHNKHNDYYRALITKMRPNIKKELSEAAILKAKNEDWELAEEIFLALRALFPDDLVLTLNSALFFDQRASSYREAGLAEDAEAYDSEALSFYLSVLAAEPPLPDAFFNAGYFYLKQSEYVKARDCFETYIALTCDTPDKDLGENGIFKKEKAQELLNEIKNQNMDDVRFADAYKLISSGETEKGLQKIREFLHNNPKVWNAWFLLGWGMRLSGKYEEARQAFAQSLSCEGGDKNADTYNEIAICCLEGGDFAETRKNLERALSLSPESTKILSNFGCLELKEGNISSAKKFFLAVLEYNPNDPIAKSQLAIIEKL